MPTTFQSSGDLAADRRFEWARESLAQGDAAGAADLFEQTLDLVPGYAAGWFLLGEARDKLGDRAGAIAAFEQARAADPADSHGAALHLMRLGAMPSGAMPEAYVRTLFDGYAARFDRALTEGLAYRGPEILLDAVKASRGIERAGGVFSSMLDLGCGTGLAAVTFRPFADRIVGVDLSGAMLAQARAKGLYDRLAEAEVVTFLRGEAALNERYDLILAADVVSYLDDLAPVCAASAVLLKTGGSFAFTVETHDGDGVILRDTLRYAHGAAAVRAALAAAGLAVLVLDPAVTRTEKGHPVPGLVCVATNAK
ncbi:MAG: methyltransferase domain-containing protein [Pseudolabrys sp.]|nr:methyltransferase domain-containing protein [Pseudolabrys sp.]